MNSVLPDCRNIVPFELERFQNATLSLLSPLRLKKCASPFGHSRPSILISGACSKVFNC